MIKRSIPWTSQPQYPVPPNSSLLGAPPIHLLNFGVGLVGLGERKTYTSTAITYAAGSAIFNGSTAFITAETSALGIANGFALACRFKANTIGAIQGLLVKDYSSDGDRCLQFRVDAAGALNFIRFNAAKSVITNITGGTVTAGRWHTAVAFFSGTGSGIYLDGRLVASDSVTTANNDISASTPLLIGCGYSAATHANTLFLGGSIAAAAVLKKLPTELCRVISDNIWQIFAPQQRNIYVSVAGGQVDYSLTCSAGAYTYTGQSASLSVAHSLSCAAGSYSYSGVATTLTVAHNLVCATGAYTYSGVSAALPVSRSLSCASGSYAYFGVSASLSVSHGLSCDAGSYTYAGVATTLTYIPGDGTVDYVLTCGAGAYAYTGQSVTLAVRHGLTCDAGAYSYYGVSASLQVAHGLTCDTGVYGYTGQSATLSVKRNLACATGSYDYIGNTATLDYLSGAASINYVLICAAGAYTYAGQSATLTVVGSWAGEPFNFASPITRAFDFSSSITKALSFDSPI